MTIKQVFSSNGLRPTMALVNGSGITVPGQILSGQGGGGGAPPISELTLPYQYLVEDFNTIGPSVADWTAAPENLSSSSIIAPPIGAGSFTPSNDNCLRMEKAAGINIMRKLLPGYVDPALGFRLVVWHRSDVDELASTNIFLSDLPVQSGGGYNGFQYAENLVGTGAGAIFYQNNEASLGSITCGTHASMGGWHWHQFKWEYNPITDESITTIIRSDDGNARHYSGALSTAAWSPAVTEINYFSMQTYSGVWTGPIECIGFWIGSLTDDWPPASGTPS